MLRLFIIHLLPLELYPPVTNLLDFLASKPDLEVTVFSTHNQSQRPSYSHSDIRIKRSLYPGYKLRHIKKMWAQLSMVLCSLWQLTLKRPNVILYYEPHSALPVYLYKRLINRKVRLFIHNHEYYAPNDFKGKGMTMVRLNHRLEMDYLYHRAEWISQTNTNRLALFQKDHPSIPSSKLFALPNYPPSVWKTEEKIRKETYPLRFLYLGVLSFENTYIREMVDFASKNTDKIDLSIYSYMTKKDVAEYLNAHNACNIHFFQSGIDYHQIPTLARNFDIGLVLHKAHNENYRFNAPNKLFESLVCNLDVWYPKELEGVTPYNTHNTYPQVIPIDFSKLDHFDWKKALRHNQMEYKPFDLYCEEAYKPFIDRLTE